MWGYDEIADANGMLSTACEIHPDRGTPGEGCVFAPEG